MNQQLKINVAVLLTVLFIGALTQGAAQAVEDQNDIQFPALTSSYLKTGDFVGPDHVRRVRPGMNKDQVRLELGNPHFSEGIFNVREWDYAFNFYTGKADEYVTCQFKVKFDENLQVTSTHWNKPECAALVEPVAPVTQIIIKEVVSPVAPQPLPQRWSLSADGLFAFGKAGLSDLQADGRKKLDELAAAVKQNIKQNESSVTALLITGHTDRIGSDASNLVLSQARAATVRDYLIAQGVNGKLMRALGAGSTQPVAVCAGQQIKPQLLQCLQPNRRVDVEVVGAL